MGIREDRRAQMQRDIRGAALDLVEERGLGATTIGHIAERVGISERTVFRYYASKEHALMPGQGELVTALVGGEFATGNPFGILASLLGTCREQFAVEVECSDFRRISRLLVKEPDLMRFVASEERGLVEALGEVLAGRGELTPIRAMLVAELVTTAWRVAWQSFARDEFEGIESNPMELFDETVRELGELIPLAR